MRARSVKTSSVKNLNMPAPRCVADDLPTLSQRRAASTVMTGTGDGDDVEVLEVAPEGRAHVRVAVHLAVVFADDCDPRDIGGAKAIGKSALGPHVEKPKQCPFVDVILHEAVLVGIPALREPVTRQQAGQVPGMVRVPGDAAKKIAKGIVDPHGGSRSGRTELMLHCGSEQAAGPTSSTNCWPARFCFLSAVRSIATGSRSRNPRTSPDARSSGIPGCPGDLGSTRLASIFPNPRRRRPIRTQDCFFRPPRLAKVWP